VLTASEDNTARIWDAATDKPLSEPLRHDGLVKHAVFSPDGTRVLTASWDKTARIWDAATGKPLGEPLRHSDKVWSAMFSPDGTRVVTASDDQTAKIWDAATGKLLGEPLPQSGWVHYAAFSPDGTRVITAGVDQAAWIWDAQMTIPARSWRTKLCDLASVVAGLRFAGDGVLVTMPLDEREQVLQRMASESVDPIASLARMLIQHARHPVTDGSMRTAGRRAPSVTAPPASAANLLLEAPDLPVGLGPSAITAQAP
jgi:DNA-binding beta-propeller fold protein YncE